jgi:1-acyl-sn-glycerol-3-phosphate acyltransferase
MTETLSKNTSAHLSESVAKNEKIVFCQCNTKRLPAIIGRLWYFWSLFVAAFLVGVIAPPILLFLGLIQRKHWLYPVADWGARVWLKLSGVRVVVKGAENLSPEKSYVFASNHRSYLDTAVLFAFTGRKMSLVAKKELLKIPIFGYGMQWVNILPIDRSNQEKAFRTMQIAADLFRQGYSFGAFVEGTRAMPSELLPFKKGAFYLAIETGAEIVPVAIKHSDKLMGKKQSYAEPGTMEIVLLPPISTKNFSAEKQSVENLRNIVRGKIASELNDL